MSRTSGFLSTVATVFSQTSLTLPTPFPVSMSTTSIDRPSSSQSSTVSRTTSNSSSASTSSSSAKSSSKSKKLYKKMKEHKDVWWTSPYHDGASKQYHQQPLVHEWNYMYL